MTDRAESEGFTTEELETWSAVATMLEWLPAALDAQLRRDAGVSHFEFGILFALQQAEERTLRMSALAGFANSTLSRLSRAVARLEGHGWVSRRPDPADGRITLASLTEEGDAAVRSALPGHVELVRRLIFTPLAGAEAKQLAASARAVTGAIRSEPGWAAPV